MIKKILHRQFMANLVSLLLALPLVPAIAFAQNPDPNLPVFSKSFAPATVPYGGRSTLTFLIDCTVCQSNIGNLDFTDNLPPGMVVAGPANASTTCGDPLFPAELTAVPGSGVIVLNQDGIGPFSALGAGQTCEVNVDVTGAAVGSLLNVTDPLLADFVASNAASATLNVTGANALLTLTKEFTNDPAAPGGTVNLEFSVTNRSRTDAATAITFDDDLNATIAGLQPATLLPLTGVCGAGSSLNFSGGLLTLTGGDLAAAATCTFDLDLSIPVAASDGSYTNTAGPVSGDIAGSQVVGNSDSDLLFVVTYPVLTIDFTDDPVVSGSSVTLEYTITNPDAAFAMSDIGFVDELTDGSGSPPFAASGFLPFPVGVTLPPVPNPPCGAGSSLSLTYPGIDRMGLELVNGDLAAGASCTFSVSIDIPASLAGGSYLNTTGEISAELDGAQVVGPPASDTIVVASAPRLSKSFLDDPIAPGGGSVVIEFNLNYSANATADATEIAFTDDLDAALTGLVAASVDSNTCAGSVVDIITDPSLIDFSAGTLAAGQNCSIRLTLTVPVATPAGSYTNTSSAPTALVGSLATSGAPAEDDLVVSSLAFSKEFITNPVVPGDVTVLRFTIENVDPVNDASDIFFTDNLGAVISGLAAVASPTVNTCGGSLSGTTFLIYTGGSVLSGSDCVIEVEVLVPVATADNTYNNVTSALNSNLGVAAAATTALTVESNLLDLTKEFVGDPVHAGDPVALEFNLSNLSGTETVTDIAFTDNLAAALSGLAVASVDSNSCTGSTVDFSLPSLIDFSGAALAPGQSCAISLTLMVPAGPLAGNSFTNTTSSVAGTVGALDVYGDPASDVLSVTLIDFTKSFSDVGVASGTVELSFTIENLDTVNDLDGLAFTDDLDSVVQGLIATTLPSTPCGSGSTLSGTSFLNMSGGELAAGASCTFTVELLVPANSMIGDFTNTTSNLFAFGLPVAAPATADLTILGTVGGSVNGLAGAGLVLSSNGEDISIPSAGPFEFTFTPQSDGSAYDVEVSVQPTGLSQTCTVSNGSGNLAGTSISSILVNCVTNAFNVGGSVNGLAGSGLVLSNNGEDIAIPMAGPFDFTFAPQTDGSAFDVTVSTQPTNLSQTCVVSNGSGVLAGSDVANVVVTCTTDNFSVGGNVTGLDGSGLVLSSNGQDIAIPQSGPFSFTFPAQADGSSYDVTVSTQPTGLSQICSVTGGAGILAGSNITQVSVSCTTQSYSVSGSVSGLAGSGLVLSNNGEDIAIPQAGPFSFTFAAQVDGSAFDVVVSAQPVNLSQTCTVANGSGVLAGGDFGNVVVTCADETFSVSGSVSGLAGSGLVLSNNGEDIAVPQAGPFNFTFAAQADGSSYDVLVSTQPDNLSQTCTVANGSGTLAGADVTNVTVSCVTSDFSVGGSVNGLAGSGLVITNNGENITIPQTGPFDFMFAAQVDGSAFDVTVSTQPGNLSQTCTVSNGSGVLAGSDVSNVVVTCVAETFSVSGSVSGLAGSGLTLSNNGEDIVIPEAGPFNFSFAAQADGSTYDVLVSTQPGNLSQTCTVGNGSGTLAGTDVTNVTVTCVTGDFSVGGSVNGLTGSGLVLSNNGEDITIPQAGPYDFTFAAQADGSAYDVTVSVQPANTIQTCTVLNGSGIISGNDIVNITVDCLVVNIAPIPSLNRLGLLLLILAMMATLFWRQSRVSGVAVKQRN